MVSDYTTTIGSDALAAGGVSIKGWVPHGPLTRHPVQFTGSGAEYFRIWIVNFFLSVITLGIYSAWAKVRRQRYFYGNTFIDGHNFEYHAFPKRILIGRIIAVGIIVGLNVLSSLHPALASVSLLFVFVFPWLIIHSLRFNARVTSYRNVHFNFVDGSYWRALWVFGILPTIAVLLLGLLLPVAARAAARFVGDGLRYGEAHFKSDPPLGPLYGNYFLTLLFAIGVVFVMIIVFAFYLVINSGGEMSFSVDAGEAHWLNDTIVQNLLSVAIFIAIWISLFIGFIVPNAFLKAGNRNIVFGATRINAKHYLISDLNRLKYAWIIFSNMVLTIFSFGLLYSWCAVRLWRYKMEKTMLLASDSLDGFIADQNEAGSAIAAEYLDVDGFDFGF